MTRVMPQRPSAPSAAPGLPARQAAAAAVEAVLHRRRPLDEQFDTREFTALDERDRGLARALAATVLRRLGTLRRVIGGFAEKGIPPDVPRIESALLTGAAQILFFDVPDHAAVDLSVRLVHADRRAARAAGFVNAVLRRTAREGRERIADAAPLADLPEWLQRRWRENYGEATAGAIASAIAQEPALDLTVKQEPLRWAAQLGGRTVAGGTVRLVAHGPVSRLPGFEDGQWWVQDAAAALPVRLFGDLRGRTAADLCAAPGGKTAQRAQAGARVTAVDRSPNRLERLAQNLRRLGLEAETRAADGALFEGGPFDAVLVDAPCSSTGTIRRHPDIAWLKSEADLVPLTALQARLLDRAADLVRPGGTIVYCTCSLEPEEGERAVAALLARRPGLRMIPLEPAELPGMPWALAADGGLRTLPSHLPDPEPRMAGLDGFYAARIGRI